MSSQHTFSQKSFLVSENFAVMFHALKPQWLSILNILFAHVTQWWLQSTYLLILEMEAEGAVPIGYMPFLWQRKIARELMGASAAFQSFCSEMVYITSTPIHLVQECHVAKPKVSEVAAVGTLSARARIRGQDRQVKCWTSNEI